MMRKRLLLAVWVLVCAASGLVCQELPKAKRPEDAGFSSDRMRRIGRYFQAEVDTKAIPGAVVLVARDGKLVYEEAFGFQDHEKSLPMKSTAIFRIA